MGGTGRAKICFQFYRLGIDPLWYFANLDQEREDVGALDVPGWTRSDIQASLPTNNQIPEQVSPKVVGFLERSFGTIESSVATLANVTTCNDGTIKLLLQLHKDNLKVETVLIPWDDRATSTLCISSQVGCRQGCTFCATGAMGIGRSLTSDEILAQIYWANKICRLKNIYPIHNVVFMGLGEPADNAEAVTRAANRLVDPDVFQLAPKRVTISTVGPNPHAFRELSKANVMLAWSVHSSKDKIRKKLVPSTTFKMVDLRSGLLAALKGRSNNLKRVMLEMVLIDGINDSQEDALHLVDFCRPFTEEVRGVDVVVNLIAWNDIHATAGPAAKFTAPSHDKVLAFQEALVDHGISCFIRTTRGEDGSAACGMLTTKKTEELPS